MKTEEKAKAYDEALGHARQAYGTGAYDDQTLEAIFPQLRESEDERTKRMLNTITYKMSQHQPDIFTEEENEWFNAYLEKQKEHQNNSDAPNESSWTGMISSSDKDKNLDEIAQDYVDRVKEYNPEPTWNLMQTAVCYGYHLAEQKPVMIQWTGKNLKEVIDFTGKSPKFGEWFKSWEDYENYVHSHDDILKLFCEDGSHYEVPVGAWIVKTPDGYNTPSRFRLIQKPAEQGVKGRRGRIGTTPEPIRKKAEAFQALMGPPYDADDICSAYETGAMENVKPAEWSEKHIADIFEKVGLAKIAREQGNDKLTSALQDAMLELSKVENAEWSEENKKDITHILRVLDDCYIFGGHDLSKTDYVNLTNTLRSLRSSWKPSEVCYGAKGDPDPAGVWKPSEEQKEALEYVIRDYREDGCNATANYLQEILDHLKNM